MEHTSDNSSDVPNNDDEMYMTQALKVARRALCLGEVPVGCVLVLEPTHPWFQEQKESFSPTTNRSGVILSHGANQVNATRDATRHAEVVAIDRILTRGRSTDQQRLPLEFTIRKTAANASSQNLTSEEWQKLWDDHWINAPDDKQHWKNQFGWRGPDQSSTPFPPTVELFRHCSLYVTCEPCIMCAAALATVGIRRVVFGCKNDRFGGNGSLLCLHEPEISESSKAEQRSGYEIVTGVLEGEAIHLLRSFYERENIHAPDEKRRRKEGMETTTTEVPPTPTDCNDNKQTEN
eukprot:Nitzschia sp. Nitz4//scaffold161_size51353//32842//33717//NITZ4_006952-RA/size51353-processed-gene-0.75-mRNA-1//-1//CDS//3329537921//9413//frame0